MFEETQASDLESKQTLSLKWYFLSLPLSVSQKRKTAVQKPTAPFLAEKGNVANWKRLCIEDVSVQPMAALPSLQISTQLSASGYFFKFYARHERVTKKMTIMVSPAFRRIHLLQREVVKRIPADLSARILFTISLKKLYYPKSLEIPF